jgi:hypothetical protein
MMNLRSAVLGCVAAIAMAVPAFAGPIQGQIGYGTSGTPTYTPTTDGTSLADYAGTVTFSTNVTSTGPFPTIDDFAGKTLNSGVAASTFTWNATTVTINYGTLGSFTGDIVAGNSLEGANSSYHLYAGTFTPGTEMAGFDATAATLSIQINRTVSGATPTLSGTLTMDESTVVPEPTTYALAAFGAIAMGVVARRRRA